MRAFILIAIVLAIVQVALANTWQLGSLKKFSNLMGVFAAKGAEAHYALTDTSTGKGVYTTTDFCTTGVFYGPAGSMNMDISFSADQKTSVMSGLGGVYVGAPFSGDYKTVDGVRAVSQSVESFSTQSFGVTGSFSKDYRSNYNGLMVSTDAGQSWDLIDIQASDPYTYAARYGAFPTESTWYISTGSWYTQSTVKGHHLTSRITMQYDDKNVASFKFRSDSNPIVGSNGYNGGIFKTTDAGKTWSMVYSTTNMYFNQINCADEMHCVSVGENDYNAYAMATTDGGVTWNPIYTGPAHMSLTAVRMLSTDEIWVGGGIMFPKNVDGYYLHTLDGGATWTNQTLNGMVFDMSFKDGYGYASYMTPSYTSASVYK